MFPEGNYVYVIVHHQLFRSGKKLEEEQIILVTIIAKHYAGAFFSTNYNSYFS